MGGDYYDRDVYTSTTSSSSSSSSRSTSSHGGGGSGSGSGFSHRSEKVFNSNSGLKNEVNPQRFKTKNLTTNHENPIVCAIDVTGSMGNWTKIIYDKLPMFYGQIMMQNYLSDPTICFSGVGDCFSDDAPLQVTDFGQGRQIDQLISKIWLEGGGGGGYCESYELAAYFFSKKLTFGNRLTQPFFFLTGDEIFYDKVKKDHVKECFDINEGSDINTGIVFRELKDKFKQNVFLLKKPYWQEESDKKIKDGWVKILGGEEHVIEFDDPKAVVDIMLGVISIVSGSRTMNTYIEDMKERGQENKRIQLVKKALTKLSNSIRNGTYGTGRSGLLNSAYGGGSSVLSFDDNVDNEEEGEDEMDEDEIVKFSWSEYKRLVKLIKNKYDKEMAELQRKLEKKKEKKEEDFPAEFLCPITQEVLVDPVITDDGHSYEKFAIEMWLENHDTSPMTNKKLKSKTLRPNIALRNLIRDFVNS